MAADDEQRLIDWAQSYNAYERIASAQEHMNSVFVPLRQEWEVSGQIPEWVGVDLLRAWAFYCARAYRFKDPRPLLEKFPELRAILNAIRNHPAALDRDMPPEPAANLRLSSQTVGEVDSKAGVLFKVCEALDSGDFCSARETLRSKYPFKPVEKVARRYSVNESMKLFIRDGFIDRYTGTRLINPGVLRLLHVVLEDDFPTHPHGKLTETHLAFWELFPTVDHVKPVSRGGSDDDKNRVTASMLSNQAKDQWTLADLGWKLHPRGDVAEWDGRSRWLVDYLAANPTVLEQPAAEHHRGYIRRWLTATKATLEVDD